MVKILVAKKLSGLFPVDEAATEVIKRVGQGEIVSIDLKRPRNLQFHRRFFCMLQIILNNQSHYRSIDDLLDLAKLSVGHYRTIETAKFGTVRIPESISFAAMDDAEFQEFYDKVVAWVASDVIPGLRRQDLDEAVEASLLGFGD